MSKPYEVGYGKPPVKSQFKKGESGNPGGRPIAKFDLPDFQSTYIKELRAPVTVIENGKKKKMTQLQAVIKSHITQALKGDKTAIKQILECARKLPEHAFEDDGVTYYRITPAYRKAMEDLERELNSFTIVDGKVIAVDSDAKKP